LIIVQAIPMLPSKYVRDTPQDLHYPRNLIIIEVRDIAGRGCGTR
jgi:hypothetical protein